MFRNARKTSGGVDDSLDASGGESSVVATGTGYVVATVA